MMRKILLGTTAVLAGLTAAAAAHAQTAIVGGGSTLASPSYLAEFSLFQNANSDYDFSDVYTPEGSGAAQLSVISNAPAGFDFGASDATISAAQLNTWNTGATGSSSAGLLIELPMIGTSITLPVNLPTVTSDTSLNLTDAQVCGIFSGKFATWSAAGVSGLSGAANNITVGYRGDNSGTSFLFTQHLAAVCTTATSNVTFTATQSFSSVFTSQGGLPANFKASSGGTTTTGSPAVQYTVSSTSGAIGYLSPDYTQIAASPHLASGVSTAPFVAEVNGVQPTAGNTQAALNTGTPVPLVASDAAYTVSDPNSFVPVAAKPTTGYPIVGYTTWLLPQCFADSNVAAGLKSFLAAHYSQVGYKQVYNNAGFSTVPALLFAQVNSHYLTGASASVINGTGAGACAKLAGR